MNCLNCGRLLPTPKPVDVIAITATYIQVYVECSHCKTFNVVSYGSPIVFRRIKKEA